MTMYEAFAYSGIFCWTLAVFFSAVGYGQMLPFGAADDDYGANAAFGLGLLVFLGGILAFLSLVGRTANLAVVLLGCAFFLSRAWSRWRKGRSGMRPAQTAAVIALVAVCSFRWVKYAHFNVHDDYHSYLNFPMQLLATGTLDSSAFNERALMSLGGNSYIQSLFVFMGGVSAQFQSEAIGLIVLCLLLWGALKSESAAVRAAGASIALFTLFPYANSSALVIASALFLNLFLYARANRNVLFTLPVLAGLALSVAALSALKSSFIPPAILSCLVFFALAVLSGYGAAKSAVFKALGTLLLLTLLFILPWLVLSYNNFGTFLYPFLGRGFHLSARADYPAIAWDMAMLPLGTVLDSIKSRQVFVVPWALAISLLAVMLLHARGKLRSARFAYDRSATLSLLAIVSAALVNQLALLRVVGEDAGRYSFPFTVAALYLLVPYLFSSIRCGWPGKGVIFAALFVLITPYTLSFHRQMKIYRAALADPGIIGFRPENDPSRADFTAAQRSVPEGARMLVFVDRPFHFDFGRNRIFLCDSGSLISLPPGMPSTSAPGELALYFRQIGIEYLVYSKNDAGFSRSAYKDRLNSWHRLIRVYTQSVFAFILGLENLKADYLFYENANIVVLRVPPLNYTGTGN